MNLLLSIRRAVVIFLFAGLQFLSYLLRWVWLSFRPHTKTEKKILFANSLVNLFRDLGATFIKLGQIMSTRPDLFSQELIQALLQLQDNVGPFDFQEVKKTIESDFSRPLDILFAEFKTTPIASASVAQVHEARLYDGSKVAVKVRRPKIEELCFFDLSVMRIFAHILEWIPSFSLLAPLESFEQFATAIQMQLDFTAEAENNLHFQKNFSGNPDVIFPKLYKELCSKRVLTMEFIEGVKIFDCQKVGADPKRIGRIGFNLMLQMVFLDGFVHADLHPGNILITNEQKVALLDLGMVAFLDEENRSIFLKYFAAWAQSDGETMARILLESSPSSVCKEPEKFVSAMKGFVLQYQGKLLGEVQVAGVVFSMLQLLRKFRIRINPTFTMVNIAIALTEGIGKQLDPKLDLLSEALPFFIEANRNKKL